MSDQKFSFSDSFQKSKDYVDTQVELLKLKAIARSSRIMGALVLDATKLLLTLTIIFFLSLALGFFLGELMNSYALGFLTTGGIFFVILMIIRAFEPKLESKFMDLTIRKVLGKWQEEDDIMDKSFSEQNDANNSYNSSSANFVNDFENENKD